MQDTTNWTRTTGSHKSPEACDPKDLRAANMRGRSAIEDFAGEATEAMGKLSLAFAELMQSGDIDDDTCETILDAIGVVAMDLRLIRAEAKEPSSAPFDALNLQKRPPAPKQGDGAAHALRKGR